MKLHNKLVIFVIGLFAIVIVGLFTWRPIVIKYYSSALYSTDLEKRIAATIKLFQLKADKDLLVYYAERYDSKNAYERMKVVDELCKYGLSGKKLIRTIFTNRCKSEQVLLPRGELKFKNGERKEIRSFFIDKFEVTLEKYIVYDRCKSENANSYYEEFAGFYKREGLDNGDEFYLPVVMISWNEANDYAKWIGMRLPNEEEWKYASLPKVASSYPFEIAKKYLSQHAWFRDCSKDVSHLVGQKQANEWGVYDMLGNVWEWCYSKSKYEARAFGGCFENDSSAFSKSIIPNKPKKSYNRGFRVVRNAN